MNPPAEDDQMSLDADVVLSDSAASSWLKAAVRDSLARDPVDALNDSLVLAQVLDANFRRLLELDEPF